MALLPSFITRDTTLGPSIAPEPLHLVSMCGQISIMRSVGLLDRARWLLSGEQCSRPNAPITAVLIWSLLQVPDLPAERLKEHLTAGFGHLVGMRRCDGLLHKLDTPTPRDVCHQRT